MGERIKLLAELEQPFESLPQERRLGRMLVWKLVEQPGFNPLTQETVMAERLVLDWQRERGCGF
jgi:hypothetical protein